MHRGAIVRTLPFEDVLPGGHVVVLSEAFTVAVQGRRLGYEVRDTLLVLRPQGALFAFLLRKPCSEATVAENVLRHGTGALNIDECRISTSESLSGGAYSGDYREKTTEWQNSDRSGGKGSGFRQGLGEHKPPAGRWPSNLVLVHAHGCQRAGSRTVKAPINRFTDGMKPFGNGAGHPYESMGGGTEEQIVYDCVPGCPVAELDGMSGATTSKKAPRGRANDQDGANRTHDHVDLEGRGHNESGGASRFYPQFENEAELLEWLRTLLSADGVYVSV